MIASLTVLLSEFDCDLTRQACSHINYRQTFVLSSKPLPLTRIARICLDTTLCKAKSYRYICTSHLSAARLHRLTPHTEPFHS